MDDRRSIQLSMRGGEDFRDQDPFDPARRPELYVGILWRRTFAFFVDIVVLTCLFALALAAACTIALFSFGLISLGALLALPMLGVLYDVACVGGRNSATPGMRIFGIKVRAADGKDPDYWQAFLASILFWVTAPASTFLVLLFGFFDKRSRLLHDILSGTVVLRLH